MSLRHTGGMSTGQLRDRLGGISGPTFRASLNASLGAEALRLTFQGFRDQRDPYGRSWAPVARGGTPLIRTGHLRASAAMQVLSDGFRVGMAAEYAAYHQFGTRRRRFGLTKVQRRAAGPGGIRRRTMIPTPELGGLGRWRPALNEVTARVIRRWGAKP